MTTLGAVYQRARFELRDAMDGKACSTPDLDARLLIARACALDDHAPLLQPDHVISAPDLQRVEDFLMRRSCGEPVARILGEKAFWGQTLKVNEHTLVPRPETEGIVEAVLSWVEETGRRSEPLTIVDLGTGSGALLIALLSELDNAYGCAVDISEPALRVAVENADRFDLGSRFFPVAGHFGDALCGAFDVIVSNPPYIGEKEAGTLSREVLEFDPARALFAGDDGLDAYREILPWCFENMDENGFCMVEHGHCQSDPIRQMAIASGFQNTQMIEDMAKLPRFLRMWRKLT